MQDFKQEELVRVQVNSTVDGNPLSLESFDSLVGYIPDARADALTRFRESLGVFTSEERELVKGMLERFDFTAEANAWKEIQTLMSTPFNMAQTSRARLALMGALLATEALVKSDKMLAEEILVSEGERDLVDPIRRPYIASAIDNIYAQAANKCPAIADLLDQVKDNGQNSELNSAEQAFLNGMLYLAKFSKGWDSIKVTTEIPELSVRLANLLSMLPGRVAASIPSEESVLDREKFQSAITALADPMANGISSKQLRPIVESILLNADPGAVEYTYHNKSRNGRHDRRVITRTFRVPTDYGHVDITEENSWYDDRSYLYDYKEKETEPRWNDGSYYLGEHTYQYTLSIGSANIQPTEPDIHLFNQLIKRFDEHRLEAFEQELSRIRLNALRGIQNIIAGESVPYSVVIENPDKVTIQTNSFKVLIERSDNGEYMDQKVDEKYKVSFYHKPDSNTLPRVDMYDREGPWYNYNPDKGIKESLKEVANKSGLSLDVDTESSIGQALFDLAKNSQSENRLSFAGRVVNFFRKLFAN